VSLYDNSARGVILLLTLLVGGCDSRQNMSFFVSSAPAGDGGNLGGLAGADAHCQRLATAAGSPKQWRAYLSTSAGAGAPAINARDRIGSGPWLNAQGVEIASSLEALHGAGNRLGGRTSLDEQGSFVPAGVHDILTGTNPDGTAATGDATCRNWTSTDGHAMVGHSNKVGGIGGERARSWNSAHLSEGCSMPALKKLGSGGLIYCFATE
jgi:hypothetical protein